VKLITRTTTIWDELKDRFRAAPTRWQLAVLCAFIFCVLIVFSCIGTGIRRIIQGCLSGQQATQPPVIQPYQFGERAQEDAARVLRRTEIQQDGIEHSRRRFDESQLTPEDQRNCELNRQRQQEEVNRTGQGN